MNIATHARRRLNLPVRAIVFLFVALIGCLILLAAPAEPVAAQGMIFEVDIVRDLPNRTGCRPFPFDDDCSLRGAITRANQTAARDTIVVPAGYYVLEHGQLQIATDLILRGESTFSTTVSGAGLSRVFDIGPAPGSDVLMEDLTIADGMEPGDEGAGIRIGSGSVVILRDIYVFSNVGQTGGGINNRGFLQIRNSTIERNDADLNISIDTNFFSGRGGGIRNWETGVVMIRNSTIHANSATAGGGIFNSGLMSVVNSTINGNKTYASLQDCSSDRLLGSCGDGGGIYTLRGSLRINNSTVSGNSAGRNGGGIFYCSSGCILAVANVLDITYSTIADNYILPELSLEHESAGIHRSGAAGTFRLRGVLFAGNDPDGCGGDPTTSLGGNLSSDATCHLTHPTDFQSVADPEVDSLGFNGGPTLTHALLPGSPAINKIPAQLGCPSRDQRGYPRSDGLCDIGAFERQPIEPPGP